MGLDLKLVIRSREENKSTRQAPRNSKPVLEVKMKEEIHKLLKVGFIKPIQHHDLVGQYSPCKKRRTDKSDAA